MEFILLVLLVLGYIALSNRIRRLEDSVGIYAGERKEFLHEERSVRERPISKPEAVISTSTFVGREHARDEEFEFKIGSRVLTGVGVLAVLLGVGFFLRYAFENDLINETMRVALGLLGGLVLLVIGWFTSKRFPLYGQAVTGGGLGLFYLSLYAAYNFYNLISQPSAFFWMIVVTALGVGLSLFYDAFYLAAFALLGGFLTPLLLQSEASDPHSLFVYISLLNLGIFAIAWRKVWPYLTIGSFLGTVLVYIHWLDVFYTEAHFGISLFYSSLLFLIFLVTNILHQLFKEDAELWIDVALTFAIPLLYFALNLYHIESQYPDYSTAFVVGLGILYLVLGLLMRIVQDRATLRQFSHMLLAISFILFVIAIPVQFEKHWITIGWGAEALAMLTLGFILNLRISRFLALAVFTLVLVRLFALDFVLPPDSSAWANSRFITFFFSFVFFSLASLIFLLKNEDGFRGQLSQVERDEFDAGLTYMFASAYVVSLIGVSAEVYDFFRHLWLPVLGAFWALAGGILSLLLQNRILRGVAYTTFAVVVMRILIVEGNVDLFMYEPVFNIRVFVGLVFVLCASLFALMLHQWREVIADDEGRVVVPLLFLAINGMLLWLISVEILDFFNQLIALLSDNASAERLRFVNMQRASLSVAWTLYAAILLIVGIIKKSTYARISSIFLFGIVVAKVFLVDTSNLNNFYRFISFISLGIILLLSGYLYYRFRERILEFIKVDSTQ